MLHFVKILSYHDIIFIQAVVHKNVNLVLSATYWLLGSFLGIASLVYLSLQTNYPLIAAPFGASAVLLYAVPESPLAQPRNVIGGNILGALTC